jgi:hypothetical protein
MGAFFNQSPDSCVLLLLLFLPQKKKKKKDPFLLAFCVLCWKSTMLGDMLVGSNRKGMELVVR